MKKGRFLKNDSFVIYYKENDLPYNRYGISVGKKIGNAVIRNKYKRKLRAIIDNYKKDYIKSQDYIIILREKAKEAEYDELNTKLIDLFNRIGKEIQ